MFLRPWQAIIFLIFYRFYGAADQGEGAEGLGLGFSSVSLFTGYVPDFTVAICWCLFTSYFPFLACLMFVVFSVFPACCYFLFIFHDALLENLHFFFFSFFFVFFMVIVLVFVRALTYRLRYCLCHDDLLMHSHLINLAFNFIYFLLQRSVEAS